MGVIWTIIIGFVAGVIAKFVMPGENEPSGFILTTILELWGHSWQPTLVKLWAGIGPEKARVLSERSSGPSSCCSSTGW
jgi:uncharacterized membrane protein YeaQ/YmgE (transglycosylase-associated protein family)